ncbi:ATP-binding sensor histidine kinase [Oscillatoria sp. FACHB-1406]|uniref:trifunctional serine/threonine-protein kinase/ATP-binding protein/sensor histidine kinase n=1 Tax=Oscillatoria sp. FACHB-1406 TaxID=2692846 RepID=UPI00168787CA|nr:ATP-binding sensor histidine kinase [Oscillatoria sp. FACHB-1406]MBD2579579.1 AAA family ATPase [Oscillatoria sp. FACHB-1406]
MTSIPTALPGYQLTEQLYCGSRTSVYRGIRNADGFPVIVKFLRNEYPSFSELLQFRNQYTIAKNLDFPGTVKPLALEPYRNNYALIMPDEGYISLRSFVTGNGLSSENFLKIGIQLAEILHQLYQNRVIHKDIKPANILIHPETQQVKLIDFSISSLLPKETQEIQNPNTLEGTLAYISPEQTGRMNRGIDYRSDFYALGVTFYELLTGCLPFESKDPMELIHSHIAKIPAPFSKEIPKTLANIVMKLMAKNAEARYQSALGLKHDLETCLEQLQETGKIENFAIGKRDMCDRFLIPEKLYGREAEVQTLLNAFERVATGASELMLVAGFSGIGKTAVVNEVHKPIVRQRGYFIKGKFDQFNRDIPFSAFVQAFRSLMGQLLCESDTRLAQWKASILEAVGEQGQVLIEVIPELAQIIGKQPTVSELSGSAAQNRFNLLFQKFIAVFTTQEHPLVMFLDDLQWTDSASLSLLKLLLTNVEQNYLFIIGAYRDNEVFPAHPLMLTLDDIRKAGIHINTLTLAPLSQRNVNHLTADALSCSSELTLPLTELVYQKTQGNPFFTTQFLKALHEDGPIAFNWEVGSWQCDLANVRSLALTDDVVEFMALQLQKLPVATQNVLKLAACIGNQFDLDTLAIVSEQTQEETATHLWKALQEGLILPQSHVYKFFGNVYPTHETDTTKPSSISSILPSVAYRFLHDRVQQAAYSLIPDSQKQSAHLKVGELLFKSTSSATIESKIFDIVNQLNKGSEIPLQQSEKDNIAQLNLIAGKKAKASTAYKAAVDYLKSGIDLLAEDSWDTHYQLTFDLYREGAECQYLTGNLERAEQWFDLALSHARATFEKADIYGIEMYLKMTQGENIRGSFDDGLKGLSILGMPLPRTEAEQQAEIQSQLERLEAKLAAVSPSELFDLPEIVEPNPKVCMSLLADIWAAAYMGGAQSLSYLSLLKMIDTSLTHGNAEASGFAYCLYGMSLASKGEYQKAYEFGTLALKLDRHFNSTKFIFKTNNIFAHTINPYNRHLKTNLSISRQAFQTSQEGGDVVFGVWAVSFLIWAMIIKGDCLSTVYAETEMYLGYVRGVNDANMLYAFTLQRQFLLNLQDASHSTDLLYDQDSDDDESELPYIQVWREKRNFEHGINWYCFLKLQLSYLYGHYADAVAAAKEAEPTLPTNAGFFPIVLYHFYYPLSLAALYPKATQTDRQLYWDVLQQQQQHLKAWADSCPENFLHKYLLLSAEMAVISGKALEATDLYDRAIALAKANEYTQEEALANELAAKFYLNWGKPRIAREYMIEAYYGYARWGAKAKVSDLETRYPQLLAPILQPTRTALSVNETVFPVGTVTVTNSSSTSLSDSLDLAAILKASQTLSSTIELNKLLSTLLHTVMQTAGGNKCVLMLQEDEVLTVRAVAELSAANQIEAEVRSTPVPVESSEEVPISLINSVKRSLQPAVIGNAMTHPQLSPNVYIQTRQPKSILCSPILHQGKLLGIVYLENNLVAGAFTRDRVELLNLLCAQAAISLENARLYSLSQQYARQLEQSLQQLQASEARFQKLANNVPGLIYQIQIEADGSASTPYVSSGCQTLYGVSAEDVMSGKFSLRDFEHPDDRAEAFQAVIESAQALTPFRHEWRIITPNGNVKWVKAASQPEIRENGRIIWDGMLIDISDRKIAEQALEQKTRDLEEALENLQSAQLQLVQSEKMSALGNLVAGVAHEINNPVSFIAGNLKPALDYINDLFGLIERYQQEYPNPTATIQDEIEAIELEYVQEDLPKLISSMQLGIDRIRSISNSLRTFSRADKDCKVSFDIHEGIDSTILILKHRLKANDKRPAIAVVTDYGNIPTFKCFPGQLNQVFMNILANAIDMFDEMARKTPYKNLQSHPQRIIIKTVFVSENDVIKIQILDNGKGMSEDLKAKIFDHLFTTKAVGKGTGLGLTIARQIIVEKHDGAIVVRSHLGEGTEFEIALPLR